ncbi:hypothetical protein ACFQ60_23035 [Streptomyces zhihengii]
MHAVLTLAADTVADLRAALAEERQEASVHKVVIVFEQDGGTLPGARAARSTSASRTASASRRSRASTNPTLGARSGRRITPAPGSSPPASSSSARSGPPTARTACPSGPAAARSTWSAASGRTSPAGGRRSGRG